MEIVLISSFVLYVYMSVLFLCALYFSNNGVADVGYGGAFLVLSYATLLQTGSLWGSATILILVSLWAVRLISRIFLKNFGKPEDFRYKAWRVAWGSTFLWRSYLQVYLLQGLVVLVVASPLLAALIDPREVIIAPLFYVGVLLWSIGFFFESVGDYQLDQFIHAPEHKGSIMTRGLWRYSRHPNYFGESTMWFGIWIASVGVSASAFLCIISPLLITYLLLKVSGVPLLEKRWEGRADWEAYKSKTSVFFPLPPKKIRPTEPPR